MPQLLRRTIQCIVTCCYIGYLPYFPGTYASAFTCLLVFLFPFGGIVSNIIAVCFIVVFSTLCIHFFKYEGEDPSYIVIDEMAGMFVTMAGHNPVFVNILIGFILFRVFDIIKPYPIRLAERLKGAYGIVADDVLAGIFANIVLCIYLYILGNLHK